MIPIAAWTSITILGWTYVLNALFHFLVQCAQRQGVQPSLTYYALRSLPAAPRALTHTVPNADGVELGQIDEIEEGLLGLLDLVKHPAICHLPNSGTLMSHNGTLSKAAGILFPSIRSSTLFEQDSGGHHAVDRSTETNMDVIPYTQLGMSFCPVAAVIKWMKLLMFAYALMMVPTFVAHRLLEWTSSSDFYAELLDLGQLERAFVQPWARTQHQRSSCPPIPLIVVSPPDDATNDTQIKRSQNGRAEIDTTTLVTIPSPSATESYKLPVTYPLKNEVQYSDHIDSCLMAPTVVMALVTGEKAGDVATPHSYADFDLTPPTIGSKSQHEARAVEDAAINHHPSSDVEQQDFNSSTEDQPPCIAAVEIDISGAPRSEVLPADITIDSLATNRLTTLGTLKQTHLLWSETFSQDPVLTIMETKSSMEANVVNEATDTFVRPKDLATKIMVQATCPNKTNVLLSGRYTADQNENRHHHEHSPVPEPDSFDQALETQNNTCVHFTCPEAEQLVSSTQERNHEGDKGESKRPSMMSTPASLLISLALTHEHSSIPDLVSSDELMGQDVVEFSVTQMEDMTCVTSHTPPYGDVEPAQMAFSTGCPATINISECANELVNESLSQEIAASAASSPAPTAPDRVPIVVAVANDEKLYAADSMHQVLLTSSGALLPSPTHDLAMSEQKCANMANGIEVTRTTPILSLGNDDDLPLQQHADTTPSSVADTALTSILGTVTGMAEESKSSHPMTEDIVRDTESHTFYESFGHAPSMLLQSVVNDCPIIEAKESLRRPPTNACSPNPDLELDRESKWEVNSLAPERTPSTREWKLGKTDLDMSMGTARHPNPDLDEATVCDLPVAKQQIRLLSASVHAPLEPLPVPIQRPILSPVATSKASLTHVPIFPTPSNTPKRQAKRKIMTPEQREVMASCKRKEWRKAVDKHLSASIHAPARQMMTLDDKTKFVNFQSRENQEHNRRVSSPPLTSSEWEEALNQIEDQTRECATSIDVGIHMTRESLDAPSRVGTYGAYSSLEHALLPQDKRVIRRPQADPSFATTPKMNATTSWSDPVYTPNTSIRHTRDSRMGQRENSAPGFSLHVGSIFGGGVIMRPAPQALDVPGLQRSQTAPIAIGEFRSEGFMPGRRRDSTSEISHSHALYTVHRGDQQAIPW